MTAKQILRAFVSYAQDPITRVNYLKVAELGSGIIVTFWWVSFCNMSQVAGFCKKHNLLFHIQSSMVEKPKSKVAMPAVEIVIYPCQLS